MKLPLKKDLISLIKSLKKDISVEYRSSCQDADDATPCMDVTIGANKDGPWPYQTGDNSYAGSAYHYPYWAVVAIDRRSNSREIADDIRDQLADLISQDSIED